MINRQTARDELARIAARATSLRERLHDPRLLVTDDPEKAASRLSRWRHCAAGGNRRLFDRRLEWDGIAPGRRPAALGEARWQPGSPLPPWTAVLEEVLETASALSTRPALIGQCPGLDPDTPLPFAELLVPMLLTGRRRLESGGLDPGQRLAPGVSEILLSALATRLSYVCSRTFARKLEIFRRVREITEQPPPPTAPYTDFVSAMLSGGLLAMFREFSALARLVCETIERWVEENRAFLGRLHADWTQLEQTFEQQLGAVVGLGDELSDPHHGGCVVKSVLFDTGLKVVYKPRDVRLNSAFQELIEALNSRGLRPSLATVPVIAREGYGWVGHVERAPCPDRQAATRFFERIGALLFCTFVLEGNDCHHENLVAAGEHPVLIDLESLLAPRSVAIGARPGEAGLQDCMTADLELSRSVLQTGLLPQWQVLGNGEVIDISALGSVTPQATSLPGAVWVTDQDGGMHPRSLPVTILPQANVPTLGGAPLAAADHVDAIAAGFSRAYRLATSHRELLSSWLSRVAGLRSRLILRQTRLYTDVIDRSLHPAYLREGIDRSIELEVLCRALLSTENRPAQWELLAQELADLERLDIPHFVAPVDRWSVPVDGRDVPLLTRPAVATASEKVRQLSEEDLERQLDFIRCSFVASSLTEAGNWQGATPGLLAGAPVSSDEAFAACALRIARRIERSAYRSPEGAASWIGLTLIPSAGRYQLGPTGYDLYSGNCGVATFLSGLAHAGLGDTESWRALALAALEPVGRLVSQLEQSEMTARLFGIGGGVGLGGLAFALLLNGQLLEEPTLIERSRRLANVITPRLIAADERLDLLGGAAGALLALLAIDREGTDTTDQAIRCGDHLLAKQVETPAGFGAWPDPEGRCLTGLSHGASGIALSLLMLARRTGLERFERAALEALAFERAVFSVAQGNWPDYRSDPPDCMTSWCHGAPGIGLARLEMLPLLGSPAVLPDLEHALRATRTYPFGGVDHLCCGNAGRAEFLLEAGRALDLPELVDEAREIAARICQRAGEEDEFTLFAGLPPHQRHPGFHQGDGGIGYFLLRLICPTLPSALLWRGAQASALVGR